MQETQAGSLGREDPLEKGSLGREDPLEKGSLGGEDPLEKRSLGGEDPLEKGMATHSGILAWRIPRTEEFGRLQSMGLQRVGHD